MFALVLVAVSLRYCGLVGTVVRTRITRLKRCSGGDLSVKVTATGIYSPPIRWTWV